MSIQLKNIGKSFGDFSLQGINLDIKKGEYFVILGPNGAGKTLLLEIIAGLLSPDTGTISGVDLGRLGFIYQDYLLFPHFNVRDNIAYGLKVRGEKGIEQVVRSTARQLGIETLLERGVANLSGGEKQRVAIARAMAISPSLYLIDEPTAALDRSAQLQTQRLFVKLHRDSRATFIHITHNFEEALALADRMAVLFDGSIHQVGRPEEVFNHPGSRKVADFLGYQNVFFGSISNGTMKLDGISVSLPREQAQAAYIAIPADEIIISPERMLSSARNNFPGTVSDYVLKPTSVEVLLDVGVLLHVEITRKSFQELGIKRGSRFWAAFKVNSIRVFDH